MKSTDLEAAQEPLSVQEAKAQLKEAERVAKEQA
jgi:hypothetical protein